MICWKIKIKIKIKIRERWWFVDILASDLVRVYILPKLFFYVHNSSRKMELFW
jgi:hypothetical protein